MILNKDKEVKYQKHVRNKRVNSLIPNPITYLQILRQRNFLGGSSLIRKLSLIFHQVYA